MAPETFLHIESPDSSERHVQGLTGLSARIGSGSQCEVPLRDPALAEVQCILRRRGASWWLQPVGPARLVTIDAAPVEHQRVLAAGVPFQVGRFRLTLQAVAAPVPALGSYERPIDVEPIAAPGESPVRESFPAHDYPDPAAPVRPPIDLASERERLVHWQARLASRERLLRDRERRRPWEFRLRSRAPQSPPPAAPKGSPMPAAPATPLDLPPRVRIAPDVESSPGPPIQPPPPPPPTPPTARPAPVAQNPRRVRYRLPAPARRESEPAPARGDEPRAVPDPSPAEAVIGDPGDPPSEARAPSTDPSTFHRAVDSEGDAPPTGQFVLPVLTPGQDEDQEQDGSDPRPTGGTVALGSVGAPRPDGPREEPGAVPGALAAGPGDDPHAADTDHDDGPVPADGWEAPRPFVAHTSESSSWDWPVAAPDPDSPPPEALPGPSRVEPHWPSARAVIEQHRAAGAARIVKDRPASKRRRARPEPTVCRPPDAWTLPAWVAAGPAFAACLLIGTIGLFLAQKWGRDDRVAGQVADLLLDPRARAGRSIDAPDPPATAWWATTPGHLVFHAAARHRDEPAPGRDEDVRFLLEAARSAAPLDRSARLASAELGATGLGLSRDVIALRRTGRLLLQRGQVEPGLRALRSAMELAITSDLDHAPAPSFQDDASVRRFTLPQEDVLAAIIAEALESEAVRGDFDRLAAALPRSPVAALAAYRVLRGHGSPDAPRALERVLAADVGPGGRGALALAAQAEALAFQGRWDEAADRYQDAIGRQRDGPCRRAWSLNLAEIEAHRGRDDAMREAWDAARGTDPKDPINVRLAEARQRHEGSLAPRPLTLPGAARRDDRVAPAGFQPRAVTSSPRRDRTGPD
jgi:hypothetical protein